MQAILKWVNFKTIGYAIIAYGVLSFIGAKAGVVGVSGTEWYNNLILTILTGLGSLFLDGQKITLKAVLLKIASWFKFAKPSVTVDRKIIDDVNDIAEVLQKLGDSEGVNLCKELNNHIFDVLYSSKKIEAPNVTEVK